MKNLNYKEYSKLYDFADGLILDLINSRKVFQCLYNDAILEDEKKFYKGKIDLIDAKLNFIIESQNLILKFLVNKHKQTT